MRGLCADHNWIDLSHRRLERQPVNGSPARVQALNRLIVREDQRILPGDDKLHPFGVTALRTGSRAARRLNQFNAFSFPQARLSPSIIP